MSKTVAQIFATNPTTVVADTDLYYLVQSPYTPGADAAISGASLKAAFGAGGTINPGLANEIAYYASSGSTISGLTNSNNGVLITSGAGVPSISSTLPSSVQTNITSLGTITTGIWHGTVITGTFGGTGVNNGSSTITIGGNVTYSGAFTFTGTLTGNTSVTFPTSGTLATTAQIPTGAALTKVDDTNVTLTLGGSPATALINATSLTLGWTGTLSGTRGGTGANNGANTAIFSGNLNFAAAFTTAGAFAVTQTYTGITNVTFPTSGTLATTSQLPTPAALTKVDDTNVTLTLGGTPATALLQATSLTLGWTGQLSLARGGTNANLTASNGGIFYSTSTAAAILAGTATANLPLLSQSSTAPVWGSFALSLGGALTTAGALTTSGAFSATFTFTNTTNVTFPTSGTLSTTTGTVTSVATSGLATGGPITTTGTVTVTAALQADMETATSITKAVVPGVVQFHPGVGKVFLLFHWASGTPTNDASYNVSSLTDTGTGAVTVNFTTSFSTANYALAMAYTTFSAGAQQQFDFLSSSLATGSVELRYFNNGTLTDNTNKMGVIMMGDQ